MPKSLAAAAAAGNGHGVLAAITFAYARATVELRQLAAFAAVAEHLSFRKAADALGVAQPAVSQLVRRLERDLELTLFERSSHRVVLTAAGQALLPHARSVLAGCEHLNRVATDLRSGRTAVLRVATTAGTGPRLGAAISAFSAAHPHVELELPVLSTREKIERLISGELDVALMRSPPPAVPGLHRQAVWEERYVAVLPAGHPAAADDPADLRAVGELPMLIVARESQPAMHDELLAVCRAVGIRPRLRTGARSVQDTIAIVASGAAWTLYIEGNLPVEVPGVAVRRLPSPDPPSTVWALWRAVGASDQAQRFVRSLAQ